MELAELKPVVETVRQTDTRLKMAHDELAKSQHQVEELTNDVKQREALIQDLMIAKSELLAERDKLQADIAKQDAKAKLGTGGDGEDQRDARRLNVG